MRSVTDVLSCPKLLLTGFIAFLCMFTSVNVRAGGFREEVAKGNRAYMAGDYEAALKIYEEASVKRPESPQLYFNKALIAYRQDDLAAARNGFEQAALTTKDLGLEALAHYNLGNVSVREAERQVDGDLEKAIGMYETAVKHYQRALELKPGMEDAVVNTEVVRTIIKDLLDKLQNSAQEEPAEMEEIVRRLAELIEEEASLLSASESAAEQFLQGADLSLEDQAESQRTTKEKTQVLAQDMLDLEQSTQQQSSQPSSSGQNSVQEESPLSVARAYVAESAVEQAIAATRLSGNDAEGSVAYQRNALVLLQKALEELTEPQDQEQQPEQEEKEEEQQQDFQEENGGDEAAEDILREEDENRRQRAVQDGNRYSPVDKDW
jgi:tetratricopeptide (TPR) repeat protein